MMIEHDIGAKRVFVNRKGAHPHFPRNLSPHGDTLLRFHSRVAPRGSGEWCCEPKQPHLLTHVETTAGPIADAAVTNAIHEQWPAKQLLPHLHIVDTGYLDLDAELLVTTQRDYGVELLGPTRPDYQWPAQAGHGFDASHFVINWEPQQAIYPMGQTSIIWTPATDRQNNEVIQSKFSQRDCHACASRLDCTRAKRWTITVRPQEQYLS
jgi:transposase